MLLNCPCIERAAFSGQQRMPAMSSRYFCYQDFLIRHSTDYAQVMLSDPATTVFQDDPFYADEFIPAFNEQYGETTAVFHAHAFDATTILLGAIEDVAIDNGDGSLSIPRQALRDAVFATNGYDGIIGTITCTELGDCATDVTIGVFQAPAWPVEGGEEPADAVYSDTLSLDDVL